jgi:predicted nucleotidyltransferase
MELPREALIAFCEKWRIVEFALFGSVLRDDFGPDSDVDVLVKFAPEAGHSLFDLVRMQNELKALLGREIDLVSRRGIEGSRNYLRRKAILESAEVVYAA